MNEPQTGKPGYSSGISLPAKVTGIVFWGMVLVGLLASAFLLHQRETQLKDSYHSHILLIEHELEKLYATHQDYIFDHEFMSLQVEGYFNLATEKYPLEAFHYVFDDHDYQYGQIAGQQEVLMGQLFLRVMSIQGLQQVEITVYMEGLQASINQTRKQMIIMIGGLVFLFGLILQQILQKVLSAPILDMVQSAQKFTSGEQVARFDEKRHDEFGYLAKFINQALDSILQQQQQIEQSRKALYEEKIQAEITLSSIMDGVITTDARNAVRYVNPVAERLIGLKLKQAKGQNLAELINLFDDDSGEHLTVPTQHCMQTQQVSVLSGHTALVLQDGKTIHIEASAAPMRNDEGELIGSVMVIQDVSQERKLKRQLSYQASHDMLTGLFNRLMFEQHLESVLLNVQQESRHHALCYVDLDQFKIVNDTCGHVAGDELLRQMGDLLKSCIREGDTLARLGGDEFGLLLENCELQQAVTVADKMREAVRGFRFGWHDKSFEIGASIGVVGINADNYDKASIMASADMACYAAKDMGRNRVHVYEPSDARLAEQHGQMHWASRISNALDEQRMVLFEQPIVSLDNEQPVNSHCEILLRMKGEDGSLIQPNAFIPAAERYNLMQKVDRWVIAEVFRSICENASWGRCNTISNNLSGISLVEDGLLDYVLDQAKQHQVDLSKICFEITETAAITNLSRATHFIKELKQLGCKFSLDDFGSGLSSFNYLKNLPIDYLKIDGSFIVDILKDPIDKAMVDAIVRLGHVLQVKVIAEWVENEETLKLLHSMGLDYVQGYHLGRPTEVNSEK